MNPVTVASVGSVALPVLAKSAEKIGGGVGGAVGGLFGKKGKKIGKAIGGFAGHAVRKIFGFNTGGMVVGGGGKVRITPVKVRGGYAMGGQVVPAKKSKRKSSKTRR